MTMYLCLLSQHINYAAKFIFGKNKNKSESLKQDIRFRPINPILTKLSVTYIKQCIRNGKVVAITLI